jgi:hypothetical protein
MDESVRQLEGVPLAHRKISAVQEHRPLRFESG